MLIQQYSYLYSSLKLNKEIIMKHLKSFFTLLFISGFVSAGQGQVWVDAMPGASSSKTSSYEDYTQARKNSFINFSYVSSSFQHDPLPGQTNNWGPLKEGSAPTWGAMMEFGTLRFYSDNFMLQNRGNLGLYMSNGLGVVFYDYKVPISTTGPQLPFMLVDLKLGPVFRYFLTDDFKTDLYLNIGGIFAAGGLVGNSDSETIYEPTRLGLAFQTGAGFNLVYGILSLGAQFTFAKSDMGFKITEDPTIYGPNAPDELEITYPKVKLNTVRFHLGFIIPRD